MRYFIWCRFLSDWCVKYDTMDTHPDVIHSAVHPNCETCLSAFICMAKLWHMHDCMCAFMHSKLLPLWLQLLQMFHSRYKHPCKKLKCFLFFLPFWHFNRLHCHFPAASCHRVPLNITRTDGGCSVRDNVNWDNNMSYNICVFYIYDITRHTGWIPKEDAPFAVMMNAE